jgi:hypothetical protein
LLPPQAAGCWSSGFFNQPPEAAATNNQHPVSAQSGTALKSFDTGLGFSVGLPATWVVGRPSGNNKFVAGSKDEDFSIVVTDFGPVPADAAEAEKVYRSSFDRYGFSLVTTADAVVAGAKVKRYVFSMKADAAEGHVEVVMLTARQTTYGVMVVTPVATAEARRPLIGRIFESITVVGR